MVRLKQVKQFGTAHGSQSKFVELRKYPLTSSQTEQFVRERQVTQLLKVQGSQIFDEEFRK